MEIVTELGGLVQVGAGTIVVWFIFLLFTGRILTRSTHEKITGLLQETIAELRAQLKAQSETVNPAIQRVLDSLPVKPEPPGKG